MVQSVMDTLEPIFVQKYNQSGIVEITDSGGNVRYSGKGWKVFIPVIQTDCPAGAISGSHNIVGWTEFVMAQLINKGQCAVNNSWAGNQWTTAGGGNGCTNPSPDNAMRAIFGYYSCKIIPANPSPAPGPRTALANRLRLVRMYQ
jgi:hypothetical protein